MKLYKSKLSLMADDIAKQLIQENAIEVSDESLDDFKLDIASILKAYVDTEQRIRDEAQQLLVSRNLDFDAFARLQREVAKKYDFAIGDDAIDWIMDQLIEMLYHTDHVDEVWSENNDIRRIARDVLQKYTLLDKELDTEVRKHIKNLSEGSLAWEIKYQQVAEELRKNKGYY